MSTTLRKVLRYGGWAILGLLLLVLIGASSLWVAGGRRIGMIHEPTAHPVAVATDPAEIAEGGRLAGYWGCVGCHDENAGGSVFFTTPFGDRLVAANLTRVVHEYTPEELERAIRHGVRRDGSSLVVMPSSMFADISDEDLGRVIGYLRSLPVVPDSLPPTRLGLLARFFIVTRDDALEAPRIDPGAAHGVSPDSLTPASGRADTLALGRYLARTGCPECHGPDLRGFEEDTPDLRIAAAYAPAAFLQFFRDGIALGGRELGLMSEIARYRGGRLTDPEVAALHAYLSTLAD